MFKKEILDEYRCVFWLTALEELDGMSPREFLIKNENDESALKKVSEIVSNM
jgi:hypothetical protein